MAIKIISTDQVGMNGVKCAVYGDSGVGKTVLCSTAPNPLIISAEKGLLSLRKKNIPVIEIRTVDDLSEVYSWLITSQEAAQYWTICIDSLSELAEVLLAHLIKTVGAKDPRKAYGELVPQMSSIIRSFRDLQGKHVVFVAKQEPVKDEGTGIIRYAPSAPGQKLTPQIPYFFDELFAMRIGKDKDQKSYRYLQTQPDFQYVAKDRSDSLNDMEEPNLTVIFNKILEAPQPPPPPGV